MTQQEYKYPHNIRCFLKHKDEYIQQLSNERNCCNNVYDGDYFFSVHQDRIECWKMLLEYNKRIWFIPYKQKKPYITPEMQVTNAQLEEDIMCVSSEGNGKPGHGWGDKNHDHFGPPGQNKKNGIENIWEQF